MSYRDMRNFCEKMRNLGFQRRISIENFRHPNFELVAEILYWLVERYDPSAEISDNIEEEENRVEFIKSVSMLFATKARIKLNPRRLYEAGANSVKEMLKIANMLYKAVTSSGLEDEDSSTTDINLTNKVYNLKQARQLASEITESGAKLHDLLEKADDLKAAREKALDFLDSISTNLGSDEEEKYIEACIQEIMSQQKETVVQMQKMVENLKSDEESLEQKIKRRADELERAEKRLKSIENVRPAFMDEYEQLEKDLDKLYLIYVEKFRNLDHLENELDKYNKREEQKREENQKKMAIWRNKIKEEEYKMLTGEADINVQELEDQLEKGLDQMGETGTGFNKQRKGKKMMGNMKGPSDDEDSEIEGDDDDDEIEGEDGEIELDNSDALDDDEDEGDVEEDDSDAIVGEDEPANDF